MCIYFFVTSNHCKNKCEYSMVSELIVILYIISLNQQQSEDEVIHIQESPIDPGSGSRIDDIIYFLVLTLAPVTASFQRRKAWLLKVAKKESSLIIEDKVCGSDCREKEKPPASGENLPILKKRGHVSR